MTHFTRLMTCSGLCLVLAGFAGCEAKGKRTATVQGAVTVDGELASSGTIAFHPSFEGAPVAHGSIRKDGTFALRVGRGNQNDPDYSKIVPGDYIATVMIRGASIPDEELAGGAPPKPGARISAAKYTNKETSGLSYKVEPGLNVINIPVERAAPEDLEPVPTEDPNAAESEAPAESTESAEPGPEEEFGSEQPESDADVAAPEGEEPTTEEASP